MFELMAPHKLAFNVTDDGFARLDAARVQTEPESARAEIASR